MRLNESYQGIDLKWKQTKIELAFLTRVQTKFQPNPIVIKFNFAKHKTPG